MASIKKSVSKLKFIKSYLRLSIVQKKLNTYICAYTENVKLLYNYKFYFCSSVFRNYEFLFVLFIFYRILFRFVQFYYIFLNILASK